MAPFFYQELLNQTEGLFYLDEAASKHCSQVLRMQADEALVITNGKGLKANAIIKEASRKKTLVEIKTASVAEDNAPKFGLAIAFTKNNSRNEWMLEKATEMGISDIYPILTQRGERNKLKFERLNGILISAMIQSQQLFLPKLHEAEKIGKLIFEKSSEYEQKFVAHCVENQERKSYWQSLETAKHTLVLIGPEGDFSSNEIEEALQAGFDPVSFGANRLRTETAGLYACTVFNAKNNG